MAYEECGGDKTFKSIIEIYNSNMGDTIPMLQKNKKCIYLKTLFDTYGFDFIDAVIEVCILYKLSSPYAFFKVVVEDYIANGITTSQQIKDERRKHRSRMNVSSMRNYDIKVLEWKLLGWEKNDIDNTIGTGGALI